MLLKWGIIFHGIFSWIYIIQLLLLTYLLTIATSVIFTLVAPPDFFLVDPSGFVKYFSYHFTVLSLQGVPDMCPQHGYESYFLFDLRGEVNSQVRVAVPCCLLPEEFLNQIEHLLVLGSAFMFFSVGYWPPRYWCSCWHGDVSTLNRLVFLYLSETCVNILNKKTALIWILKEIVYIFVFYIYLDY